MSALASSQLSCLMKSSGSGCTVTKLQVPLFDKSWTLTTTGWMITFILININRMYFSLNYLMFQIILLQFSIYILNLWTGWILLVVDQPMFVQGNPVQFQTCLVNDDSFLLKNEYITLQSYTWTVVKLFGLSDRKCNIIIWTLWCLELSNTPFNITAVIMGINLTELATQF